jgi:hypothetical protein
MIPQVCLRPPRSPLGEQLGIDRARLIFAEAFLEEGSEAIDAEMGRASVIGAVEKRTVRIMLCHVSRLWLASLQSISATGATGRERREHDNERELRRAAPVTSR